MKHPYLLIILVILLVGRASAIPPWQAAKIGTAIKNGTWQAVEQSYRELLKANPAARDLPLINYNLGLALLEQKKYQEAEKILTELSNNKIDDSLKAKTLYNLGNTLFALNKLDEAKKTFQDALLLNPDDDDARHNIEVILDKQKNNTPKDKNKEQKDKNQKDKNDKNKDQQQSSKEQDQKDKDSGSKNDQKDKDQDKEGQQQKNSQGGQDQDKNQQPKPQDGGQKEKDASKGQPQNSQGRDPFKHKGSGNSKNDKPSTEEGKGDKAKQNESQPPNTRPAKPAQSEEQRKADERSRLLEFFRQQERQDRPPMRALPQPPTAPGGQTW